MKRYDIFPEGGGTDICLSEDAKGGWVDADVAQELYDALKDAMRSARKDFPLDQEGEKRFKAAYAEQFAALEKADKD